MQVLSIIIAIIFSIRFYSETAPVMTPMIQRDLDGQLSTVITLFKILDPPHSRGVDIGQWSPF